MKLCKYGVFIHFQMFSDWIGCVLYLRNLAFGLDYWTRRSHRFQLFDFILAKKVMGKLDGGGWGLSICLLFCTFCATINLSFIKFSFVCHLLLTSSEETTVALSANITLLCSVMDGADVELIAISFEHWPKVYTSKHQNDRCPIISVYTCNTELPFQQ